MLCGSATAVAGVVAAASGIEKYPIDESAAIQSERTDRAGGTAACRCDLGWNAPAVVPAEGQRFYSDR